MNYLVSYYLIEADGTARRVGRSYVWIEWHQRTPARIKQLECDLAVENQCAGIVLINLIALDGPRA